MHTHFCNFPFFGTTTARLVRFVRTVRLVRFERTDRRFFTPLGAFFLDILRESIYYKLISKLLIGNWDPFVFTTFCFYAQIEIV